MSNMVRVGYATKLADQLSGPRDLGSNVSFWGLVSRVDACSSGVEVVMPSFIYKGCCGCMQKGGGSAHLDSCSVGSGVLSSLLLLLPAGLLSAMGPTWLMLPGTRTYS